MPHFQGITADTLTADVRAAYNWLQTQPGVAHEKIGSIGFCLGGRASFIANLTLPLAAAVSYYGGGTHLLADRAVELHAPQLFFWGGRDQHIKPEHVAQVIAALDAADKPYINTVISYADHAFFCDARPSYHPQAAAESWALTLAFLQDKLGK